MVLRASVLFCAVALLLSSALAAKSDMGSLACRVVDAGGAPIASVKVTLSGPGKDRTTATNARGEFEFTGLQEGGHYDVSLEKEGFEPFRNRVVIEERRETQKTFKLQRVSK